MRTIAIGDIHGCNKAIRALIETINPLKDDLLVFVGDYIDRGPDSRGTIDYLLEIESKHATIFLRGNHEIMFGGCVLQGMDPTLWFQMGGRTTLVSYGGRLQAVPSRHRDFILRCVPSYENEHHIFVHANYLSHLPVADQPERTLYWEHLHDRIPAPHFSGKKVWVGHSPQIQGQIADFGHLICIDTYCFGGKYLTAVDVDSREVWQSDKWGNIRGRHSLVTKLNHWMRRHWAWIRAYRRRARTNPIPESARLD